MQSIARDIALQVEVGDVITLKGEVGAGKTKFAQTFIKTLAKEVEEVTSPTFMLMQSYDIKLPNGKPEILWHIDLYRLKSSSEAEALGLRELGQNILLIEWPDIIEPFLPPNRLEITFGFSADANVRSLQLQGHDTWQNKLKKLGL
jgi:tRNA threonylcarbamoyladenosine biosynthesis protein TsaE